MKKVLHQIILQLKPFDLHPLLQCKVVREVMKKYNKNYEFKKGYLNTDEFGAPACITYFWLEEHDGTIFDCIKYIKNINERYFLTKDKLSGIVCIDDCETDITDENNRIWVDINSNKDIESCLENIMKLHPIKI